MSHEELWLGTSPTLQPEAQQEDVPSEAALLPAPQISARHNCYQQPCRSIVRHSIKRWCRKEPFSYSQHDARFVDQSGTYVTETRGSSQMNASVTRASSLEASMAPPDVLASACGAHTLTNTDNTFTSAQQISLLLDEVAACDRASVRVADETLSFAGSSAAHCDKGFSCYNSGCSRDCDSPVTDRDELSCLHKIGQTQSGFCEPVYVMHESCSQSCCSSVSTSHAAHRRAPKCQLLSSDNHSESSLAAQCLLRSAAAETSKCSYSQSACDRKSQGLQLPLWLCVMRRYSEWSFNSLCSVTKSVPNRTQRPVKYQRKLTEMRCGWGPSTLHSLWIILMLLVTSSAVLAERQPYRTAYGCEGASLSITCEAGHVINVIRANYGRFSITICNTHGNTEWSVNCQSRRSKGVLADRCSGRESCQVVVSSDVFGDPCPGTVKYIEVQYSCGVATTTTTTARPRPIWDVYSSRPPMFLPPTLSSNASRSESTSTTSTTQSTTLPSTSTLSTTSALVSSSKAGSVITTPVPLNKTENASDDNESGAGSKGSAALDERGVYNTSTTTSAPLQPTVTTTPLSTTTEERIRISPPSPPVLQSNADPTYDLPWCPPSFGRGLYWNWTRGGDVAVQSCPGGATGWARRKCYPSGWAGPADLGECRSAWLTALEARASSHDAVLSVADDLATVTANKALYGGDLTTAARLISTLARRMTLDVSSFPDARQKEALVTELLNNALSTASSLLAAGIGGPWGDLAPHERRHAVTQLMVGLEEAAFLLADALPRDTQAAYYDSHVLASARVVTADGSFVKFPSLEDQALDWTFADNVILSPEAIVENSERSATKAVFLTYRHLEDLLTPYDEALGTWSGSNVTRMVNSRVVSASLGHGRHIQLPKPVTIVFSLLRQENVTNPVCAFWDYTTASWSDEGCRVVLHNRSHVTCECDHLTNFAVIMEEQTSVVAVDTQSYVRVIVYAGCIICLVCLAASLVMFTLFKSLSTPCSAIHHQLCVCLLVAELVFVIGIWRTDLPILCGVVAGVLYYTILAAFTWVSLEGVQLYLSVARAVEYTSLRLRWWHYTIAYGLPLLVVSAAAIVDPFSFGTERYCWLRTDNYFVFSLVGPALALLVVHITLLGAALLHTCKLSPDDPLKSKEMARLASSKVWLRGSTTLLVLMVLTWTFGLLYLHRPTLALAIAFGALNAVHGIFVLSYYCFRNQKLLPRLCNQLAGVKGHRSSTLPPPSGPLISGPTSTLGSRGSLRQGASHPNNSTYQARSPAPTTTTTTTMNPYHPMGTFHQSLPRHQYHIRSHNPTDTCTLSTTTHTTITNTTTLLPHISTQEDSSSPSSSKVPLAPSAIAMFASSPNVINNLDEDASYKSFSRDSGHGGSEQEDSPRTHWTNTHHPHQQQHHLHQPRYTSSLSADLKNSYLAKLNRINNASDDNSNRLNLDNGNHLPSNSPFPWVESSSQMVSVPNAYSTSMNTNASVSTKSNNGRGPSPWNHTYMEIDHDVDPVYEEIERERWSRLNGHSSDVMQVSDLSDEDVKRNHTPSDMSRNSSRSYGDSRPLLPYYSQQQQQQLRQQQHQQKQLQQLQEQYALNEDRLRDFNNAQVSLDQGTLQRILMQQHQDQQQMQQQVLQQKPHLSRENLMTVAVLNGEQVVCRLSSPGHKAQPQQQQQQQQPNKSASPSCASSLATSPTSNGMPAHIVISRPPHLMQLQQQQQLYNDS
ncbi:latrophilin Cirl isoform X1 [Hyalella azteca]|uniref:Latrophilin Cirl isoform X1 n=1 Tax=Hyalella azteca TaxID=294128 RepID=A0A8B7NTD0_HYAAZ|nr:latrophilin Cirl isoform X1 [Hyalella azteca]